MHVPTESLKWNPGDAVMNYRSLVAKLTTFFLARAKRLYGRHRLTHQRDNRRSKLDDLDSQIHYVIHLLPQKKASPDVQDLRPSTPRNHIIQLFGS